VEHQVQNFPARWERILSIKEPEDVLTVGKCIQRYKIGIGNAMEMKSGLWKCQLEDFYRHASLNLSVCVRVFREVLDHPEFTIGEHNGWFGYMDLNGRNKVIHFLDSFLRVMACEVICSQYFYGTAIFRRFERLYDYNFVRLLGLTKGQRRTGDPLEYKVPDWIQDSTLSVPVVDLERIVKHIQTPNTMLFKLIYNAINVDTFQLDQVESLAASNSWLDKVTVALQYSLKLEVVRSVAPLTTGHDGSTKFKPEYFELVYSNNENSKKVFMSSWEAVNYLVDNRSSFSIFQLAYDMVCYGRQCMMDLVMMALTESIEKDVNYMRQAFILRNLHDENPAVIIILPFYGIDKYNKDNPPVDLYKHWMLVFRPGSFYPPDGDDRWRNCLAFGRQDRRTESLERLLVKFYRITILCIQTQTV